MSPWITVWTRVPHPPPPHDPYLLHHLFLHIMKNYYCVKPWRFQIVSIIAAGSTLIQASQYKWKCESIFISILKTLKQLGKAYLAGARVIWHSSQRSSCQDARHWPSHSPYPHSILSLPAENDIFSFLSKELLNVYAFQDELSSEVSVALLMTSWSYLNTSVFLLVLLEPSKGLWARKMQVGQIQTHKKSN